MAESALVSAVIPTYNNAGMVCEAVRSALDQTWPATEVVVVDDGSTDDTRQRLAREFGDRIAVVAREHRGPAVARNAGIRASTGPYVAFLDSDDLWLPDKIAKCVAALEANPEAGVAYTALRFREMDTGRTYALPQYTLGGRIARELFTECKGVNTSTLVVRRTCLKAVNGFDEDFFRAQDWDLMVRLAEQFPYVHVPEVLTERRLHAKSLSVTHRDLYAKYNLMVLERALLRRPDLYADLRHDALARAHFRFGMLHYREFNLPAARAELKQSLGHTWRWTTFNYFLRTWLPVPIVRALRTWRQGGPQSAASSGA